MSDPQARESQQLPVLSRSDKRRKRILSLEEIMALLTPRVWTPGPQTWTRVSFCCCKPLSVWYFVTYGFLLRKLINELHHL